MHPGPEPGERDLLSQRPELAAQQRAPDHVIRAAAHAAADPIGGGVTLEPRGASERAEIGKPDTHPQSIDDWERREAEQRHRRVELVDLAVSQCHRQWAAPEEVVAEPKLMDQPDGVAVGREEVVIEAIEPDSRLDLEARGQAPGECLALDDNHLVAPLCEPVGHGEPQRSSSQHGGARHDEGSCRST